MGKTESTTSELADWLYQQFAFTAAKDCGVTVSLDRGKVIELHTELRRLKGIEANYDKKIRHYKDDVSTLHDVRHQQQDRIAELTSERNNRQSDNDALRTQIVNERNELEARIAESEKKSGGLKRHDHSS